MHYELQCFAGGEKDKDKRKRRATRRGGALEAGPFRSTMPLVPWAASNVPLCYNKPSTVYLELPPVELPRAHAHPLALAPARHNLDLADRDLAPLFVDLVVALVPQRVRRRRVDRVERERHRDERRRERDDARAREQRAGFLRRSTSDTSASRFGWAESERQRHRALDAPIRRSRLLAQSGPPSCHLRHSGPPNRGCWRG